MIAARPRTPRAHLAALLLALATILLLPPVFTPSPAASQETEDPTVIDPDPEGIDPAPGPEAPADPDPIQDDPVLDDPDPAPDQPTAPGISPGVDEQDAVDHEAVAAENRKMIIIVGGLLGVAFAILLLTIRYWRVTRPVVTEPTRTRSDRTGPKPKPRKRIGRRSRRAIAGADHAGADDDWIPRTTGEQQIVVDDATSHPRPSRSSRGDLFSADS